MMIGLHSCSRPWLWTASIAAAFLLWGQPARANSTLVEVLDCQPASQVSRINLDLNGRPAQDVRLILTTFDNRLVKALSFDQHGVAVLPPLPPGKYLVIASAPENLGATLCVELSAKKWKQVSSFSLLLRTLPPPPPSREEMLAASENKGPSGRIQKFEGVVVDPLGAVIVGAHLQIFPKGVRNDAQSIRATTDEAHISRPPSPMESTRRLS
jgi:hypothetical protein